MAHGLHAAAADSRDAGGTAAQQRAAAQDDETVDTVMGIFRTGTAAVTVGASAPGAVGWLDHECGTRAASSRLFSELRDGQEADAEDNSDRSGSSSDDDTDEESCDDAGRRVRRRLGDVEDGVDPEGWVVPAGAAAVGLSEEQFAVATRVWTWLQRKRDASTDGAAVPPPPNILLLGPGGSGKSHLIRALVAHGPRGAFGLSATTGVAAANLGLNARTIHSLAQLSCNDKNTFGVRRRAGDVPRPRSAAKLRANFPDRLQCLVVDEVSMLSATNLTQLDANLRFVRDGSVRFGGFAVLLVGDFLQIPPTKGTPLWKCVVRYATDDSGADRAPVPAAPGTRINSDEVTAAQLFAAFNVFTLAVQQRAAGDQRHQEHLTAMRSLAPVMPAQVLNELQQLSARDVAANPRWADPSAVKIIVTSNKLRARLNKEVAVLFARTTGRLVLAWHLPLSEAALSQLGIGDAATVRDGFATMFPSLWVYYVTGAPCQVLNNINPRVGISNGTTGYFHSLLLDDEAKECLQAAVDSGALPGTIVYLPSVPLQVNVDLEPPGARPESREPGASLAVDVDVVMDVGVDVDMDVDVDVDVDVDMDVGVVVEPPAAGAIVSRSAATITNAPPTAAAAAGGALSPEVRQALVPYSIVPDRVVLPLRALSSNGKQDALKFNGVPLGFKKPAVDTCFAVTSWKCQGLTLELVACAASAGSMPRWTRALFYTAFSRVRNGASFRLLNADVDHLRGCAHPEDLLRWYQGVSGEQGCTFDRRRLEQGRGTAAAESATAASAPTVSATRAARPNNRSGPASCARSATGGAGGSGRGRSAGAGRQRAAATGRQRRQRASSAAPEVVGSATGLGGAQAGHAAGVPGGAGGSGRGRSAGAGRQRASSAAPEVVGSATGIGGAQAGHAAGVPALLPLAPLPAEADGVLPHTLPLPCPRGPPGVTRQALCGGIATWSAVYVPIIMRALGRQCAAHTLVEAMGLEFFSYLVRCFEQDFLLRNVATALGAVGLGAANYLHEHLQLALLLPEGAAFNAEWDAGGLAGPASSYPGAHHRPRPTTAREALTWLGLNTDAGRSRLPVYVFGALSTWMTCAFANPVCPWLIRHLTWAEVGAAAAEGGGAAGVPCGHVIGRNLAGLPQAAGVVGPAPPAPALAPLGPGPPGAADPGLLSAQPGEGHPASSVCGRPVRPRVPARPRAAPL
jgi:hypothetical protein